MNASLYEIASLVDGVILGDKKIQISSLAPIDNIIEGSLVFAEGSDNVSLAENSAAAAILVSHSITSTIKPVIQVAHPFKAFIQLLNHFHPTKKHLRAFILPLLLLRMLS